MKPLKILGILLGLLALIFFVTKSEIIVIVLISLAFIILLLYLHNVA
ncbi:MAG: hypothetical protein YYHSYBAR_001374 [Candidatus Fervidibacter sacchari]